MTSVSSGSTPSTPETRPLPVTGEPAGAARRTAVVVLGMHRSGTSALARVISLLGAALPEHLLGANPTNTAGHWEPLRVMELHERMLSEAGSRWDDWRRFAPSSLDPERLAHYKEEIGRLIVEEYGDAPLLMFKEPRICRFVPLYEEVFAELGIAPCFVLIHRNPLAVIDSLAARDDMTPGFAALLWLRHELDAEQATRGRPRVYVSYEGFLDDWRGAIERVTERLGIAWPRDFDAAAEDVEAHLSPGLRHHLHGDTEVAAAPELAAWVKEVYAALRALARPGPESAEALATLDRVREEFDAASPIFGAAAFPELAERERRAEEERTRAEQRAAADRAQVERAERAERRAAAEQERAERAAARLNTEKTALIRQLDEILLSRSWRLTAPIRAVGRRLRALPQLALLRPGTAEASHGSRAVSDTPSHRDWERARAAFDRDFYLAHNPDITAAGVDPFEHYMRIGWREGRDPSPAFCTSHYLRHAPDVVESGVNPFLHWLRYGIHEDRVTLPYSRRMALVNYAPKVSAIVPNYDHARFLPQRLDSILAQTYPNIDILVLDDGSTDGSREIIDDHRRRHPGRIRTLFNDERSGNVFRQWRKGLESTDGALVWICESDDHCEPDFVEKLVPHFRDRSVNVAFGKIQFSDRDGAFRDGLDQYREGAEPGIWDEPLTRPAREWFANGFGVNNVIANVGGCLWRRPSLSESVWDEAQEFSVLGDWFLHAQVAGGGQIAWEPDAVAYFRQHGANKSVTSFVEPSYYEEHERLMLFLRRRWDVPDGTVERFSDKVAWQYRHHELEGRLGSLGRYFDSQKLLAQERDRPHILMAFLGFHLGGGEIFPIHLANALHRAGHLVSMLALDMTRVNEGMAAMLDPAIPVYDAAWVEEHGADRFLAEAGVSLIHSHMVSLESFFFEECSIAAKIPYLVTLHGSYEASEITTDRLMRIALGVRHFVYTADKNLQPFAPLRLAPEVFSKLPNAVPIDPEPFPQTREELGIAPDAVVFTLASRAIPRKGWATAIAAVRRLRELHPERRRHLLLCGEGEEAERLAALHSNDPDITFLGYQSRIHGLFRISDVAILPTRFSGESFPFCIVEALQVGTPVIATRVGEIPSMLEPPGMESAGILIDALSDSELFAEELAAAMEAMLSPERRAAYAVAATRCGATYSMDRLVDSYTSLYRHLIEEGHP